MRVYSRRWMLTWKRHAVHGAGRYVSALRAAGGERDAQLTLFWRCAATLHAMPPARLAAMAKATERFPALARS